MTLPELIGPNSRPHSPAVTRRAFLGACALSCGALAGACRTTSGNAGNNRFHTRGVVLVPEDLSWEGWPRYAASSGLTTLGLHHGTSPQAVVECMRSDAGQRFLEECNRRGLEVEYELHAMGELLPRALFARNPEFFRMDERGNRTPDANCCVHSSPGLAIVGENAVRLAEALRPTTGRYFFWGDDGGSWCHCPSCRSLTGSEQALLLENAILKALRRVAPDAQLAHLAYQATMTPPRQVTPEPGVFLEYAPIARRHDLSYAQQQGPDTAEPLSLLEANLEVFPRETARVLEYWLDVSRFSGWKRPATELPWHPDVVRADCDAYAALGIRHVTTFAAWIDGEYVEKFGEPAFLAEYGSILRT